jgi:Mannosyl-glycoprotein endo-beta-N-acetylglucosaminidase
MSRSIQWNAVAYMISAALLASLFFSFNLSTSLWNKQSTDKTFPQWYGSKPSSTFVPTFAPVLPDAPKSEFQPVTVIPKLQPAPASINASTVPISSSVPQSASKPVSSPDSAIPAKVDAPLITQPLHTYKVTSYYLNVRALPSADSDILREVKQDTRLQVQQATENGWLALKDGGYVNARYAAPIAMPNDSAAAGSTAAVPLTKLAVPKAAVRIASSTTVTKAASPTALRSASPSTPSTLETRRIAGSDYAPDSGTTASKASNPVKPSSKVMSDSGLTKAHIAALLKGTKLQGLGLEDVILGVEQDYGINAFFTIAVMKLESGNGKSTLARTKNNLFGLNAVTGNARKKAFTFASKGDSIRKFGQLINDNYVERGFTTIEKVAGKYCPANGLWAGHVRTIMRSDFGKLT